MPPNPPNKLLSAWPETAPGGWTVETIREAITHYERGWLAPASRLARALGRCARYVQARRQAIETVRSLPLEVVAVERHGSTVLARRFATEGRQMLGRLFSDGCEAWMLETGELLNFAVAQLEWDTRTVPWTPVRLHPWPLERVRVDLYEGRAWAQTAGEMSEVEILPGDGRWVVHDPFGWLRWEGSIRCMGEPWYARTGARRDLANGVQRGAVAAIDAQLPPGVTKDHEDALAYKAQLQALQAGGAAGLLRPADWPEPRTLNLYPGQGASGLFELALSVPTDDLIVAWLGQDGTAKDEGGSYAKAKILNGVAYDLVEFRARSFYGAMGPDGTREPGTVTEQIVRPWVLYQEGGEEALVPLCRRVVPDLEEDERLTRDGKRAAAFYAELGMMRGAGFVVTEDVVTELAALRGVRLPAGVKWEEPQEVEPEGSGEDERAA